MRRSLLLVSLTTLAVSSPASAQGDPAAALRQRMWAAQVEPAMLRLAWDDVLPRAQYEVLCGTASRPARRVAVVTGGAPIAKDPRAVPRRLTTLVRIERPDEAQHCFLLRPSTAGSKTRSRDSLAFNVVQPVAAASAGAEIAAPTAARAHATGVGEVTVSWSPVPGATAYMIGRSVQPDGFQRYCEFCSTDTVLVDRLAVPGMRHAYTITAIGPSGVGRRVATPTIVLPKTAEEILVRGDSAVEVRRVGGVRATVAGPALVRLTWSADPGSAAFEILRAIGRGSLVSVTRVTGDGATSMTWHDHLGASVPSGTGSVTVRYAVKAIDARGASTDASEGSSIVVPLGGKTPGSGTPTDLRARATSADVVELTWVPAAGMTTCALARALSGGRHAAIASLPVGAARYVDTGVGLATRRPEYQLTCGATRERAEAVRFPRVEWPSFNDDGAGASSAESVPTNLRATATSDDAVMLTWGPPMRALACRLQRRDARGMLVTVRTLPVGAWQHEERAPGLRAQRPEYALACGDGKAAGVVRFPRL